MVKEGMILMHRIPEKGIVVDRAKVYVIDRLPPSISKKESELFLGMMASTFCLLKIFKKLHVLCERYLRNIVNLF